AASAQGWALYALMTAFMIVTFGAIPFTDAMIVRYVDDSHRSRVSGMRLTVSFGVSSLAVWVLGPLVKAGGFRALLFVMAATAAGTLIAVLFLPRPARGGLTSDAPPESPRAANGTSPARPRSPRGCAGIGCRRRGRPARPLPSPAWGRPRRPTS